MSVSRVEEIISEVIEILKKHLDSFTLYLFGPRGKGNNFEYSDIDLAIDTKNNKNMVEKAKMEIENIGTLYSIDIVNMNEIDLGFKEIILKSG